MRNSKAGFLDRADILRLNDDNITRSIISFNLGELLEAPKSEVDFSLKANDISESIIKMFSLVVKLFL